MSTVGEISVRPTTDFSVNGASRGVLVAYDANEEPLWENSGNWSNREFRVKAAEDLANVLDITNERASSLIHAAVAAARKVGNAKEDRRASRPVNVTPAISITARQLYEISDECWLVLQEANEQGIRFFRWGGVAELVSDGSRRIKPRRLSVDALGGHLSRRRRWVRYDGHGDETAAFPPERVMRDMLALAEVPLPPLMGVINTPVLAPSGEIVSTDGYDYGTGLYLDVRTSIPPLPATPYAGDIGQARKWLLEELLVDFPFASQSDRSHAIALMLTVILRPVIHGPTPLFMIEAPTPGSGKGLLSDAISELMTGGPSTSMSEAHGEDEWRKRITSLLQMGAPMVRIDNVVRELNSANLASVLTDQEWTERLLGTNQMVTLPARTVWMATANNPRANAEISRRKIRIRLIPDSDRPWDRDGFRHDPLLDWVQANRGQLLHALLVLVRAWTVAGRPAGKYRIGSYESWAGIVGGVLDVAEIPGFLDNRNEDHEQAEAQESEWLSLVEAWADAYGSQRVDVGKLYELAKSKGLLAELRSGRLDQAARTIMGKKLTSFRDRWMRGYLVTLDGTHGGSAQYKLYAKKGAGAAEGHQGSPHSPVQVTLGDPGDPLPRSGVLQPELSGKPFLAPAEACPTCNSAAFLKYSAAGEIYCALCNPEAETGSGGS